MDYEDLLEKQLKKMADLDKLSKAYKNLALSSYLNPRLGINSPMDYLDYDTLLKLKRYKLLPINLGHSDDPFLRIEHYISDHSKYQKKLRDEVRRDKLTKSKQKSSIMRGMETNTGPFRGIRYEPNIMEGINRHLLTMRPNTIAQRNMRLEDENDRIADYLNTIDQYGMGKRNGKHGKKRSKRRYARNRY